MNRRAERNSGDAWLAAEWLLTMQTIALVVFASWAFGGRLPWGPGAILGVAALALPLLVACWQARGGVGWHALLPLALWLALVGAQLANPSHEATAVGWIVRLEWVRWLPSTADPAHTLDGARPWIAALIQGGVLVAARLPRAAVRVIWLAVALNGCALAAAGAACKFAGATKLLGVVSGPDTYFFATFFYKNHWAAFGMVSAAAGIAVALGAWPRALDGDPRARGVTLLAGGAALLTLATLALPRSRSGALFAVVLGLAFVAGLGAELRRRRGDSRGRRAWAGVAVLVVVAGILGFGGRAYWPDAAEEVRRTRVQLRELGRGATFELRQELSRDTWRMAQARPGWGWGVGTFEVVFPAFAGGYLRENGRTQARAEFAHNDWLQVLAESGVAGLLILAVPAGWAAGRGWRRGGRAGRWGVAGCGLLAIYAAGDFPLHNPAVLMVWAVVLATAQRAGRRDGEA